MKDLIKKIIKDIKEKSNSEVIEATILGFDMYHKTIKEVIESHIYKDITIETVKLILNYIHSVGSAEIRTMKGKL